MADEILTPEEWDELWQEISTLRDKYDRTAGDIDSGDLVDAVESWFSSKGFHR